MAHVANLPAPLSMEGNLHGNWTNFINQFEIYWGASGREKSQEELPDEAAKKRYNIAQGKTLLNIAGEEAAAVADTFGLAEDLKFHYEELVKKFNEYVKTEVNDTYVRFIFNRTKQEEGQTFDNFLTDLKKKIKPCGFGEMANDLLRDRIVEGIIDSRLQEALLRVKNLKLEDTIRECRAAEQSKQITKEFQSGKNVVAESVKIKQPEDRRGKNCPKCNRRHKYGQCPAWGKRCAKCNRFNHFKEVCRSKEPIPVHSLNFDKEGQGNQEDAVVFSECIEIVESVDFNTGRTAEYRQKVKVCDRITDFKLDPGTSASILPTEEFKRMKTGIVPTPVKVWIKPFGKSTPVLKTAGAVVLPCSAGKVNKLVRFLISDDADRPLWSLQDSEDFGFITRHVVDVDSTEQVTWNSKEELIKEYQEVFQGEQGVEPDPSRISDLIKLPNPTNKEELQSVMGMFEYVRPFIPNMSKVAAILYDLKKKNIIWNWTEAHTAAFETLKKIISTSPVSYIPGKKMYIADLFSRKFNQEPVEDDQTMLETVHSMSSSLPISTTLAQELSQATKEDQTLQQVIAYMTNGWPLKNTQIQDQVIPYFKIRNELFREDGLLLVNSEESIKIVVPTSQRTKMLKIIHAGHMQIEKNRLRAKEVFFWPGMIEDVTNYVKACTICQKYQPMPQKHPLHPHQLPKLMWERVSIDHLSFGGSTYLCMYDAYSKWLEILKVSTTKIRSSLPISDKDLKPKLQTAAAAKLQKQQERTITWYNRRAKRAEVEPRKGEEIMVKTPGRPWEKGTIKSKCQEPRSYIVSTARGDLRRTTTHMKQIPDKTMKPNQDQIQPDHDYHYLSIRLNGVGKNQIPTPETIEPETIERESTPETTEVAIEEIGTASESEETEELEYAILVPDWLEKLTEGDYVTRSGRISKAVIK
ncbi:hypothetical protein KUF71_009532 [Frankliniella fusca]|uniref:RNA-directed DNA polymerase n=1 Tax=Frankliniella fusca TaxID=407009 RepID=A0AAE1HF78_9NEOP|nr:hypothetical protein KUF71_009532 [Frankliniella fusca]